MQIFTDLQVVSSEQQKLAYDEACKRFSVEKDDVELINILFLDYFYSCN